MSNPSHSDIMRKLKEIKGIKELLEKAVLLYVLLTDGDLPVWCYALIIGALAYLVNPFDVVPDPIPFAGYLDDLSIITSALAALPVYRSSYHLTPASNRCLVYATLVRTSF
ncbi:YkvA family protein, partial [Aeromonas caviae]